MIEVENLSKRYGEKLAVDGLDFVVQPGVVTGFLGPNGAGKSTTMRMIAGLDAPTAGRVRVNGREYRAAPAPMAELGILLEARAMHTGRSARHHLLALAQTNGVSRRRVDELIDMAGLSDVAGKRVGGFSLGMGQRLGIAAALLGDPRVAMTADFADSTVSWRRDGRHRSRAPFHRIHAGPAVPGQGCDLKMCATVVRSGVPHLTAGGPLRTTAGSARWCAIGATCHRRSLRRLPAGWRPSWAV